MLFMPCVCHAFASVHCCLVVTCWEGDDLLALVCDVYCIFATFPCCILGQVWYLIVLFPGLCHLAYFDVNLCHYTVRANVSLLAFSMDHETRHHLFSDTR